jgi:mRNA interferase MazF
MVISQYDVFLVNLDPTIGHEIKKTRPCLVVSPDEMNRNVATVIIAPMTTTSRVYPTRVAVTFKRKNGWIVLDQIRAVDKRRLVKRLGTITEPVILRVKATLSEMLIE